MLSLKKVHDFLRSDTSHTLGTEKPKSLSEFEIEKAKKAADALKKKEEEERQRKLEEEAEHQEHLKRLGMSIFYSETLTLQYCTTLLYSRILRG